MQYFLLGLAALVSVLLALQWFARANTTQLAHQLKMLGGIIALALGAVFLVRGYLGQALPLGLLGAWLMGWIGWPGGSSMRGRWSGGSSGPNAGQTSRIVTDHLEMELEQDTGAISGRVLKGMFAGRALESLKPVELALLWQDCQFVDPQSAQVLEAYLDRVHPTWREDMARGEKEMASGPDGRMSHDEAFEILGLEPGATEEAIRKAHRELMLKLHPDRGGSTYLASKINEAKDVLLRDAT
ncbi:MAG: DnaJ domain-containing protein [Hyphomicrobium sp.]